jgi:hypothetical protein
LDGFQVEEIAFVGPVVLLTELANSTGVRLRRLHLLDLAREQLLALV